jgi:hypothetical protein
MNYLIEKVWSRPRSTFNASYKIINDFDSSSEKECSKMDKENEKIYSRLLNQAEKAHNAIRHSGLSMNLEVPIPPRPSNRDRYLLWKRRNVSKKVIEQTEAVLFLESNGYKYNEHYEAYQAIDLSIEIKKNNGEPLEFVDNSKNFDNVYNKNDRNIFRRRSMYRLKQNENLAGDIHNRKRTNSSNIVINEDYGNNQNVQQGNPNQIPFENMERLNSISENRLNNPIQSQSSDNNIQEIPSIRHPSFTNTTNVHNGTFPTAPSAPQFERCVSQRIVEINNSNSQQIIPNFSQIESNNRLINDVKPSAPPASKTIRRNISTFGFDYENK